MTPSNCGECRKLFMANPVLQAELRHLAAIYGPGAAEAELNERLAEVHAEHGGKQP